MLSYTSYNIYVYIYIYIYICSCIACIRGTTSTSALWSRVVRSMAKSDSFCT